MSPSLPPDEVLEALLTELEAAAASDEPADVAALAARHGVSRELVENCLASLQLLAAEAAPAEAPLERAGPYELLEVLGRGGMSAVYRARDPRLEREVALKVLRAGAGATPHERARFLREAEALAALRHPNVLAIHDAGQSAAGGYLVLELVEDARPITAVGAALDWRGRVALARDAARGLGYAHARGVIHRDVKPANLLVDRAGRVRVSDFGLARLAQGERLTQTGTLIGTVGYMAPEQAQGDLARQGPASDVWGLGAVLCELLTGQPLLPKTTLAEARGAPVVLPRPLLGAASADLPRDLEAVCRRALALDPAARYPDGDALADDLDAVLAGRRPPGVALALVRARALLAAAAALAAVGVTVLLALAPRSGDSAPLAATSATPATPSPNREPDPTVAPTEAAAWEAEARGPTRADVLLAARRWLPAHAPHARAGVARALVREGRRAPLCVVQHSREGGPVVVELDGLDALVTTGEARLRRWSFPGSQPLGEWQVRGLLEARRLTGGDWVLVGNGAAERWPARALQAQGAGATGPGPTGRLGEPGRVARGATWIARYEGGLSGPSALGPDGRWIAVSAGAAVVVLAGADGAQRALRDPRGAIPRRLAFAGADRLVVARERLESGYTLELWDLPTGRLLTSVPSLAVSALAYLPARDLLVLGSHRGTAMLHGLPALDLRDTLVDPALAASGPLVFSGDEAVGQLAPLPGGAALLALPGRDVPAADRAVKWLDLARGGGGPVTPPISAPTNSMALDPDGALVAVARRDGRVEVWLLPTEAP
ncbi:MAG: WD40 repeat domain-containing serine/threonine protein kinase [Planctomycetota bacterium]